MIMYAFIIIKFNFIVKFHNYIATAKVRGHIQTFLYIPSLRQKYHVASNVGVPVILQF